MDAVRGEPGLVNRAYRFVVRWGGMQVRRYYRYEVVGADFPREGPVILAQNHNNGLADAHSAMSSTPRPLRILVKYKLFQIPLLGSLLRSVHAVPMYRSKDGVDTRKNAASFEAIDAVLKEEGLIAVFPEGESMNAIGLRSLKSGAARMAMSAMESAAPRKLNIQFVPVGVTFEDRDRLRSLASIVIGEPIPLEPICDAFETDNPRTCAKLIMQRVGDGLKELILHAETEEEHDAAVALERLLPEDGEPLGLRRRSALAILRADEGAEADRRRQAVTELGQRLAGWDVRADAILAPARPFLPVALGTLFHGTLALLQLPVWGPPMALGWTIAHHGASTPDKKVTMRLLFGQLGIYAWVPLALLLAAWFGGFTGFGVALAWSVLSIACFHHHLDALRDLRSASSRRRLDRSAEGLSSLRAAIGSIREAFAR